MNAIEQRMTLDALARTPRLINREKAILVAIQRAAIRIDGVAQLPEGHGKSFMLADIAAQLRAAAWDFENS